MAGVQTCALTFPLRAAQRIAHVYHGDPPPADEFARAGRDAVARLASEIARVRAGGAGLDCAELRREVQRRMTTRAGMVRSLSGVRAALAEAAEQWQAVRARGVGQSEPGYLAALEARELALAQRAFLTATRALLGSVVLARYVRRGSWAALLSGSA